MPDGSSIEPVSPPDALEGSVELDEQERRIAGVVINAVQQNLNVHLNTAVQMPVGDLERLKALDEGAFQLYLRRFEAQHASDIFVAEAPYRLPDELARSARPYALASIVLMTGLAGYLAYLGDTGKALGGAVRHRGPADCRVSGQRER